MGDFVFQISSGEIIQYYFNVFTDRADMHKVMEVAPLFLPTATGFLTESGWYPKLVSNELFEKYLEVKMNLEKNYKASLKRLS